MIYLVIILILIILLLLFKNANSRNKQIIIEDDSEYDDVQNPITPRKIYPYKKKYLLTKNEWYFYKSLKPLCDQYNLHIIAKVRFADLVEVDSNLTKEYNKYFNRIKSKHIDFVLTNPDNMEVKFLIELDDKTHERQDRRKRDIFVNRVCEENDYKLIHTYGDVQEIEKVIANN